MTQASLLAKPIALHRARCAFTLIELLVVCAVVGLLLALSAPAIQSVRSNSRKMQCRNQLKQLGLGMSQYAEVHSVIPPWAVPMSVECASADECGSANGCGYADGALTLVWPYLELPTKCEALQQGLKRAPILICPADGGTDLIEAPLSYCMNVSPGQGAGSVATGPFYGGFGPKMLVRLQDVVDGLSQTAAFSEQLVDWSGDEETTAERTPSRHWWLVTIPPVSNQTIIDPTASAAIAERSQQTETSLRDCDGEDRTFLPTTAPSGADWRNSNSNQTTYSHWQRSQRAAMLSRQSGAGFPLPAE